jgi:translocation and assembly module TamB
MAQGSNPDTKTFPQPPRKDTKPHWLRLALISAGVLVAGGLVAVGLGYFYIRRELPGFLETNLSAALGRPIKVGEFQRLTPTGVKLGPAIVPPTEQNFSWVKAESLEVAFNPIELLLTRTLRPSIVFVEPEMAVKQGFDGEWKLQPPQSVGREGLITTELNSLIIRNASLAVGPISRTSIVEVPEGVTSATLILLDNVNLRMRFSGDDNQTVSLVVGGRLNNGAFQIRGEAQLDTRQANLMMRGQQLPIESVNPLFGGSFFVRDGLLSCNLDAKLRPDEADPFTVKGMARLRSGDIVITDLPSPIQNINGTLVLDGVGGRLENSSLNYGPILVRAEGGIDLHAGHDLRITLPDVSVEEVETAFDQPLPIEAAGNFAVKTHITGELLNPQVQGELANLNRIQVDRLGLDGIVANFAANLDGFTLNNATIRPATGGTITAQGTAAFRREDLLRPDLNFAAQTDVPLDALAALYGVTLPENLRLGALLAEAKISGQPDDLQGVADWQLPQATFPGQGRLTYADQLIQAQNATFRVGDGTLQASADARLDSLDWTAKVVGAALPLGFVSPLLRGTLDTDLRASGNLLALTPAGIRADGTLRLSDTIPLNLDGAERLIPGPLNARFAWTGQRLNLPEAVAPNLYISGGADVAFLPEAGLPEISGMDFAARLSHFDLGAAYALLDRPEWLRINGFIDFDGTLRGSLPDPRLAGTAALRQFAVNDFALTSDVSGPFSASLREGVFVDLWGEHTEFAADIAPSLLPNSFRLVNGDLVAEGRRRGDVLDAEVRNLDIGFLAIRPLENPDLGIINGILNANAQVNLADLFDPEVAARFAIASPALGHIAAETLTGRVHYHDGEFLLTGGNLQLTPQTQFWITGSGRLLPEWQARAEVVTQDAQIQDILYTLGLYSYADFGRLFEPLPLGTAADLPVHGVGAPNASLLGQATLARVLRELALIQAAQQANALLPSLEHLEGGISGSLQASASQGQGMAAAFDVNGQNWAWGRYDFGNRFVARGHFRDQTLNLWPVEFRAGETLLSLAGDISLSDSNLEVRAENLPLTAAANLLESPTEVTGLANLSATLTGPYTDPQLAGQFAVDGASINQQPLQEVSSSFSYADAIFNLDGRVVGSHPEPLTFSGTVPYALPFMAVQPASNEIALQATLKDDALALVNTLLPELLSWGGGNANIDMRIGGTLQRPLVTGVAAFNGATFNSSFLDVSLANLTGEVQFRGTRMQVPSLTGTLFDGNFELTGSLPLLEQDGTAEDTSLQLALNDIDFRYFDEVYSQVNGTLSFTNALLDPVIGGQVWFQNTQVAVGPELIRLANYILFDPEVAQVVAALEGLDLEPIHLDNLRLTVEPAVIKAPPLFSFNLAGDLAVSGPSDNLYAIGGIRLIDGWINTITTEFFLERGRDNVAIFRPEYGLEPYLDVVMFARVPLQRTYNIQPLDVGMGRAEVPDIDPLGSTTVFDEIQIEARLKGPASNLFDNLRLTSNPPYGQQQLFGMVSGGYLSDLGGSEPNLALASNLLSALSADTQDAIGDALGLNRFRLTASTVLPSDEGDTLGYGVGFNLGITENLSTVLVQVLNQNQPIQFNARYRIDDNWGVRGSTNFGDENRVFLEYRTNF